MSPTRTIQVAVKTVVKLKIVTIPTSDLAATHVVPLTVWLEQDMTRKNFEAMKEVLQDHGSDGSFSYSMEVTIPDTTPHRSKTVQFNGQIYFQGTHKTQVDM